MNKAFDCSDISFFIFSGIYLISFLFTKLNLISINSEFMFLIKVRMKSRELIPLFFSKSLLIFRNFSINSFGSYFFSFKTFLIALDNRLINELSLILYLSNSYLNSSKNEIM